MTVKRAAEGPDPGRKQNFRFRRMTRQSCQSAVEGVVCIVERPLVGWKADNILRSSH